MDYEPFGESVRRIRLYPYLLKQYNDRWYLIGTPLATEEFPYRKDFYVNLPLDRMKSMTAVDGVEYIDCEEYFEERYDDIIGITWSKEEEMTEIILAVRNSYAGYIDTKPLHGSQTRLPMDRQSELHEKYGAFEDYTFYTLYLKPNRELYNTIYINGENIILVSPSEIRMQMISELSSVVQKLKTLDCE